MAAPHIGLFLFLCLHIETQALVTNEEIERVSAAAERIVNRFPRNIFESQILRPYYSRYSREGYYPRRYDGRWTRVPYHQRQYTTRVPYHQRRYTTRMSYLDRLRGRPGNYYRGPWTPRRGPYIPRPWTTRAPIFKDQEPITRKFRFFTRKPFRRKNGSIFKGVTRRDWDPRFIRPVVDPFGNRVTPRWWRRMQTLPPIFEHISEELTSAQKFVKRVQKNFVEKYIKPTEFTIFWTESQLKNPTIPTLRPIPSGSLKFAPSYVREIFGCKSKIFPDTVNFSDLTPPEGYSKYKGSQLSYSSLSSDYSSFSALVSLRRGKSRKSSSSKKSSS